MKFLRVIRFDESDLNIFDPPAVVDEWAISGGFAFADLAEEALVGKTRQAFANGFLGLPSFGWSTFAVTAEISERSRDELIELLAVRFVEVYGAPDMIAARAAADGEIGFVAELCAEKPINTVFTVRRVLKDGEIREEFREISPPSERPHARVWEVVENDA